MMHRPSKGRISSYVIATLCVGVCLVWYVLQSNWLQKNVQQRIVAAVQSATGGQVKIKVFRFRWLLLTAEMEGFVLHGTEPVQEAPLFRANSIRVRLQVTSLLQRDVRITSLQVDSPQLHILLRPDGRTNLPGPRRIAVHELTDELLHLKVQEARLNHGLFQVNDQRIPVNLAANDLTIVLLYGRDAPAYTLHLATPTLNVRWNADQEFTGSLQTDALLAQNQLTLTKAILRSGDSQVELSGHLRHFAQPIIDWNVRSKLAVSQLAAELHLQGLKSGTVRINGAGDWNFHHPPSFTGEIDGQQLPQGIKLQSKLILKENLVRLPDLDVVGPGLQWKGRAELMANRKVALHGEFIRLDLRSAATAAGVKGLRWSAYARGPVDADGLLGPQLEDFTVEGNLQLSPVNSGPPVSGNLGFIYRQRGNLLDLENSRLHLPGTEISVAGTPGTNLKLLIDSTDLRGLQPFLPLVHQSLTDAPWPVLLRDGTAHFDGSISGRLNHPQVSGALALTNFQLNGASWRNLRSSFQLQEFRLTVSSLLLQQDFICGKAMGQITLTNWRVRPESALHLEGDFSGLDLKHFTGRADGFAAGSFNLSGTLADPAGNLQVEITNPGFHGEHFDSVQAQLKLGNGQVQLLDGKGKLGKAFLRFSGDYRHEPDHWERGVASLSLQSNTFAISNLLFVQQSAPELSAQTKLNGRIRFLINPNGIQLRSADGSITLQQIAFNRDEYGNISIQVSTQGQLAEGRLEGTLHDCRLWGTAQVQLTSGMPAQAQLQFEQVDLQALTAILPAYIRSAAWKGSARGSVTLQGPLQQREKIRAAIRLDDLQIASSEVKGMNLVLRNSAPVFLEAVNGAIALRSLELSGRDTKLDINGIIPFTDNRPIQLKVNGAVDLQIAELFDVNLQSSGESKISAVLGGTPVDPTITGTAEFHNGSVTANGLPNSLSDLNGTIEFNQNRATLRRVTAHSGGGDVALGGFVTFSAGHPLIYRLEAAGQNVRIRYANGISVTSTSQLALTGTSQASVLSGTATISRIIFNPNTDVGALLASTLQAQSVSNTPGFLSGLQFDVHIDSAPDMQLSTALSRDVQATVDLQLRGNSKTPVLFGSIEANEGDIRVFGGRYTINRGQISFTDPARIEPVLDLDLRTQARGVNIDITIAGALNRLNINYRSDPPLQPRDIIALLAVGRAPSIDPNAPSSRLNSNDVTAQLGANTLLGQAVSPNSSRLQKLFGITNIRIDPLVQGITNTSQGRLTLEQQISRQITVTYVTNLSQTAEQIFRVEYALNSQFSLVALRDDNGEFGIDIQYKKRFK